MKSVLQGFEFLLSCVLLIDGGNRLLEPVPMAPDTVPLIAGLTYAAQQIMYVLGSLELLAGFGLLLPLLLAWSGTPVALHLPHHGARP